MKKLLSIILILSLMLTTLCSLPVSATNDDNFAAAENWKVYSYTSTVLNEENGVTASSWASVSENTNSAYANGDSSSLKIFTKSQYATLPITVEKNKNYTVSYKFYSTDSPATTNGYSVLLNKTGIIAPNHNVSPWNAENNYYDFVTYNLAFKSPDGLWNNKTEDNRRTTHWTETKKWYTVELSFNSNDNTTVMLAIMPGVDSFYVDNVTITKEEVKGVTTAYNSEAALRTADASSTGKNGMRIYNSIAKEFIEDYNIVEYGSIAVLAKNIGDELTLSSAATPFRKGVAYSKESQPTPILFDTTETEYIFTSYLTNIPEATYGENYAVRAYAIDSNGDTYYGEIIEFSVFDVAYAIDCGNTSGEQTNYDISAFKAFAKNDDNYAAYDSWLTANDKQKGNLRMELTTYN